MNRKDVAYVINTTPKYFYLLEFHIGLIRRYAPQVCWDIWIATEEPDHPLCKSLEGIHILTLEKEESGFLRCREATLRRLATSYTYVVSVQEDFLLERFIDVEAITESIEILDIDKTVDSIRWMPCPGPNVADAVYRGSWKELDSKRDGYMFTFQACIWRREALLNWYTQLCKQFEIDHPGPLSDEERRVLEIRANYAENRKGQSYFSKWMGGQKHLAWARLHKSPNAVYMSPWPYRPTAVVGGKLESWAIELATREGFVLTPSRHEAAYSHT